MASQKSEKREMMMSYCYRALFQSVDIFFFRQDLPQTFKIICEANIKLPLLKKSFATSTEYKKDYSSWIQHWPVQELGQEERKILRENISADDVLDPIGFFLTVNESNWGEDYVHLLVGAKTVHLDVQQVDQGLEVRRREKEQKLILRRSELGIEKIEIPVPVIGSVVVERRR